MLSTNASAPGAPSLSTRLVSFALSGLMLVSSTPMALGVSSVASSVSSTLPALLRLDPNRPRIAPYKAPPRTITETRQRNRDVNRNKWWNAAKRGKIRDIKVLQSAIQGDVSYLVASIVPVPFIGEVIASSLPSWRLDVGGGTITGEASFPAGGSSAGGDAQGLNASLNTATNNTLFRLPITGWSSAGDSAVGFTLFNNSLVKESSPEFGSSWTHSYNSRVDVAGSDAFLSLPDGLIVPYTVSGGVYTRPSGWFHDLANKSGGGYVLTFKDQKKFEYDSAGWLVAVKDRVGNTVSISRNSSGQIQTVTSPDSRTLSFSYSAGSVTIVGPDSRSWMISPSLYGWTVDYPTVTVGGVPQNYTRTINDNGQAWIEEEIDLRGNTWTWAYSGDLPTVTDPGSEVTWFDSPTVGEIDMYLPGGQMAAHVYLSDGLYLSYDTGGYVKMVAARNADRLPISMEDELGRPTSATWDSNGNLLTSTDALGKITTLTYNSTNDVLTIAKPEMGKIGKYSENEYYSSGLLKKVIDPNFSTQIELHYNSAGDVDWVKDGMDIKTLFSVNSRGEVTSTTDSAGVTSSLTYDNYSRPVTFTKGGNTTTTTYDEWGRKTKTTFPGSGTLPFTETRYDAGGNVVKAWNEIFKLSEWTYNSQGRLTQFENPNGDLTTYTYLPNGWVDTITNGNLEVTTRTYTDRGELWSQELADSTITSYQYEATGTLSKVNKPDATQILYEYTDRDQLSKIDYATGTDTTFTYDDSGRRKTMLDGTGTTTWTYDVNDRVTQLDQQGNTITYTYNAANQRTSMVESSGTTTYNYDYSSPRVPADTGRLVSIDNPLSETTSYTYDAQNRLATQQFHNGTKEFYTYDVRDRMIEILLKNSSGTVLRDLDYTFNNASQVTGLDTTISLATTPISYSYDDAGQLILEDGLGTSLDIAYTYDANGNRTSKTQNGVTDTYLIMPGDKLHAIYRAGSLWRSYAYDANGNTESIDENGVVREFTYDFENRLTSISGAYTASYSYNGLDTRVSKTEASVTNNIRRDGAGVTAPVLADSYATYTPGVSERRGSVTKYLHSGIKSADVQTNASQGIDASRRYDAFGAVLTPSGTWSGPFGNAGKFGYQEDATGYQLLGHRYYDPSTGRFLTRDPVQDGRNWYTYCDNSPVAYGDPNGLTKGWIVEFLTGSGKKAKYVVMPTDEMADDLADCLSSPGNTHIKHPAHKPTHADHRHGKLNGPPPKGKPHDLDPTHISSEAEADAAANAGGDWKDWRKKGMLVQDVLKEILCWTPAGIFIEAGDAGTAAGEYCDEHDDDWRNGFREAYSRKAGLSRSDLDW